MKTFFMTLILILTCGCAFGGDPRKDIYGSIDTYAKSKTIKVAYLDADQASKMCLFYGFKVIEKNKHFLLCELKKNTTIWQLIELTSCESIKTVSPNPSLKAIRNE